MACSPHIGKKAPIETSKHTNRGHRHPRHQNSLNWDRLGQHRRDNFSALPIRAGSETLDGLPPVLRTQN